MKNISDLQAGKAGEYLVCADLISKGYIAFPSEQGLPFDVVVEANGKLLKLQVKSTRSIKAVPQRKKYIPSYLFHIKRMGKGGKKEYSISDVDIFALVALDKKIIGYLPANKVKRTMIFRTKEYASQYYDERGDVMRIEVRQLREQGLTYRQIGEKLNVDPAYIHRIHKNKATHEIKGTYLESLSFEGALESLG